MLLAPISKTALAKCCSITVMILLASCGIWEPQQQGNGKFQQKLTAGLRPAYGTMVPELTTQEKLLTAPTNRRWLDPQNQRLAWEEFAQTSSTTDATIGQRYSQSQLLAAAQAYLQANAGVIGVPIQEWLATDPSDNPQPHQMQVIHFSRQIQGIAVADAYAQFQFGALPRQPGYWRLYAVRIRSFANPRLPASSALSNTTARPKASTPSITLPPPPTAAQVATLIGRNDLTIGDHQAIWLPQRDPNGGYQLTFAYKFQLSCNPAQTCYEITTDPTAETLLTAYNYTRHMSHKMVSHLRRPDDQDTDLVMAFMNLIANGEAGASGDNPTTVTTDHAGETARSQVVRGTPQGPYAQVKDAHSAHATEIVLNPKLAQDVSAPFEQVLGKSGLYLQPQNEVDTSAFHTFHHITAANRKAASYLDIPFLNYPQKALVNLAGNECNAFYDGVTLHFAKASAACPNTGLLTDIIYHEWGHALHGNISPRGNSGIRDDAYAEGVADTLALIMTDSPQIGVGMSLTDSNAPVRNLDTSLCYELIHPDCQLVPPSATIHQRGIIIGSAFYQLRKALARRYGPNTGRRIMEHLYFEHLKITSAIPDAWSSVKAISRSFWQDQEPDACLIQRAFQWAGLTGQTPPCDDEDFITKANTMAFTFQKVADNSFRLWVADPEAAGIAVCFRDKYTCFKDSQQQLPLKALGTKDGRNFFASAKDRGLNLAEIGYLTVLVKDDQGKVTQARSFKITPQALAGSGG